MVCAPVPETVAALFVPPWTRSATADSTSHSNSEFRCRNWNIHGLRSRIAPAGSGAKLRVNGDAPTPGVAETTNETFTVSVDGVAPGAVIVTVPE